jgi:hypothetical protein
MKITPMTKNTIRKSSMLIIMRPLLASGSMTSSDMFGRTEPKKGTIAAAINKDPMPKYMIGRRKSSRFCTDFEGDGRREIMVNKNSSMSENERIGLRIFIVSLYQAAQKSEL